MTATTPARAGVSLLHHAAHAHAAHDRAGGGNHLHTPGNRVSPTGGVTGSVCGENTASRGDGARVSPAWDPVWTPAVVVDLAHHVAWRQWAARQDGDQ